MTTRLEIYKCMICGNIVEVLHEGKGQLVCCGEPMELMTENTVDASVEKHVPVVANRKRCKGCSGKRTAPDGSGSSH
jgi:desulfoferrodoxin